jgi:hypothetical protein
LACPEGIRVAKVAGLGGKKLAFLPGAGLSVGYLMNGKEWIRFYTRKDDEVHKEDVDLEEAHIARVDVGLCFSGGFALDGRSGGGLRLEARYQLGLSNLDESGYDSAKNRGWCIGAVYLFPLDPNNGKGQAGAPVTPVPLK